MSVSVEGSQTPLLGGEEGENEKHFSGGTGWKTPLEAPSRLDRGKEGLSTSGRGSGLQTPLFTRS